MLRIVVDSTADLPRDLFDQYDIDMIPLSVHIDETEYLDKRNIKVEEVYNSLREGKDLKTSQPNPLEIIKVLEKSAKNGDDIIIITLSSKLSGTHQVINMVSNQLMDEYKDSSIHVIDSKGGSAIAGIMALQAALLIEKKYNKNEILEVLNDLSNHCEHIFTIADLKYIIKSGRVTKAEAFIGNVLRVKPILRVIDGEIKIYKKVRGNKKLLNTIVEIVEEKIKQFPNQIVGICHADDEGMACQVEKLLKEKFTNIKTFVDTIGSALGTHIGIGGIGIFFFNKEPKVYINQL
ncbi:DegV family protein [Haloplasma contractile]|uniref:DegV family protein n=1 Tax=Haloplasma contractile SSD-17B TaxID=1033810 RepID=U2FI61_9MOLU|nr:DegV family protein [Haloplasma contractile]ERJ12500.1 DegV family protein [Haloplasma contractile SSD-17B]